MTGDEDEDLPEPEEPRPLPEPKPAPMRGDEKATIGCSCVTGDCEEWRTRGKRR